MVQEEIPEYTNPFKNVPNKPNYYVLQAHLFFVKKATSWAVTTSKIMPHAYIFFLILNFTLSFLHFNKMRFIFFFLNINLQTYVLRK